MIKVHLVRHGEVHNPDDLVYGRLPGFGLTERGRSQAQAAAARVLDQTKAKLLLVSSPLQRALETAEILRAQWAARQHAAAHDAPVNQDARLQEAGSWMQGLPRRLAPIAYARALLNTELRRQEEPLSSVASRMRAAVLEASASEHDAEVVMVSHQLPIGLARVAFEHGLGTNDAPLAVRAVPWLFIRQRCGHASVTTFTLNQGTVTHIDYWCPEF